MKFTTPNITELRLAMATQGHHDVRDYLNGIHFDFVRGLLTGTNGHIISQSPFDGTDCADMPVEIILEIAGTVPKKADYAVFEIDGDAGTVSLFQDDALIKSLPVKVVDGTYPNIARILDPAGLGDMEVKDICLHVPYLTKVSQATGEQYTKLTFSDGGNMGVSLRGMPNSNIRLMPARF